MPTQPPAVSACLQFLYTAWGRAGSIENLVAARCGRNPAPPIADMLATQADFATGAITQPMLGLRLPFSSYSYQPLPVLRPS